MEKIQLFGQKEAIYSSNEFVYPHCTSEAWNTALWNIRSCKLVSRGFCLISSRLCVPLKVLFCFLSFEKGISYFFTIIWWRYPVESSDAVNGNTKSTVYKKCTSEILIHKRAVNWLTISQFLDKQYILDSQLFFNGHIFRYLFTADFCRLLRWNSLL